MLEGLSGTGGRGIRGQTRRILSHHECRLIEPEVPPLARVPHVHLELHDVPRTVEEHVLLERDAVLRRPVPRDDVMPAQAVGSRPHANLARGVGPRHFQACHRPPLAQLPCPRHNFLGLVVARGTPISSASPQRHLRLESDRDVSVIRVSRCRLGGIDRRVEVDPDETAEQSLGLRMVVPKEEAADGSLPSVMACDSLEWRILKERMVTLAETSTSMRQLRLQLIWCDLNFNSGILAELVQERHPVQKRWHANTTTSLLN